MVPWYRIAACPFGIEADVSDIGDDGKKGERCSGNGEGMSENVIGNRNDRGKNQWT